MNATLLWFASAGILEAIGLAAVLTTLVGVWLQWKRPAHLADIEDQMKNGEIAADAARRRARFVDLRASVIVVAGMLLLAVVAVGWMVV